MQAMPSTSTLFARRLVREKFCSKISKQMAMRGLPRPLLLSKISRVARSVSSCSLGTELNLKIKKAGKVPVALDDSQYPEWLWTVLNDKDQNPSLTNDPMKQRKKDIRIMNIKKIKMNNFITKIK